MDRARVHLYSGVLALAGLAVSPFRLGVVCGDSMSPSLRSGEPYLLDQRYYRNHAVRRGDVVVFEHGGEKYIKRVVAVEGDRLHLLHPRASEDTSPDAIVMDWQLSR